MFARMHIFKKRVESLGAQARLDDLTLGLFMLNAQFQSDSGLKTNNIDFLIDSGSCLSIIPPRMAPTCSPKTSLRAANGSPIQTYLTSIQALWISSRFSVDLHRCRHSPPTSWSRFLK